jgi:segregation and condensation protein B
MENTEQISFTDETVYTFEDRVSIIEACLFAAGHPLTYEKLGEVLNISAAECKDTVEKMEAIYNNDSPFIRGIILARFPDSCQLCTREMFGAQIKAALGMRRSGNLSQSLMETLAVIAYNQPTTRAYVDAVRGVDSSYAVGALIEKDLIEQCGRLDAPGRPALYRTTVKFLRVFGISEIEELPTIVLRKDSGEQIEISASSYEEPEAKTGDPDQQAIQSVVD